MGNSASQLPYSIDNQVGAPHDHNGWAFHNGKTTDGNDTPVSVFVGKKPQLLKQAVSPRFPKQMQFIPAMHHYNYSRKLRHPHILKVIATLDTDNPTAASAEGATSAASSEATSQAKTGDFIIVTEPCIPLQQWLLANPSPEQLAWGLECVVNALHFLHASAKLAHGNLHPQSLYVTPSGDVKLWNFSLVTPIGNNLGPTNHFQEWEASLTPESYRSPERVQRNYSAIQQGGIHAIDSFSMGVLVDHWFQGQIPSVLQKAVQRLQTPNIKMRPRLQPLLKCPLFDTPYQKLQKQLEEIVIQPVNEKVALWQNLNLSMQAGLIPEPLCRYKVLALIQDTIQKTCTNEAMLAQDMYRREVLAMIPPLFHILEKYMDDAEIAKVLGPLVALMFMVKDRGVRGALLNQVGFMTQHLDKKSLNGHVFEPLCSGFNDSSPALRELTLKATLSLVPSLNAPNLEKLSRYLVRLQSDSEPAIRTNAVIFIAKIAPNLSEVPRDKMLLPAYARGTSDTFAPCRTSSLQSIAKSVELFSKADLAAKVLPVVSPLLMDPIADVRKEAFRVLNGLVRMLQQESDRLAHVAQRQAVEQPAQQQAQGQPAVPQAAVVPPPASAPAPAQQAPKPPAAPSSGYLSGLSSWMSSSAKPDAKAPATAPVVAAAPVATPSPVAPTPPPPVQPLQTKIPTTPSLTAPIDDSDGWGDDGDEDGWGDDDDEVEEDPFAKIGKSTQSNAIATPTPVVPSFSSPGFGDDDDPFAAIGMKPAMAVNRPKGKLLIPKKTTSGSSLKIPAPAPAMKLTLDASDEGDGWDDF
eukprot:Nitzschia sp. Nitz4//scaffold223_size33660//22988//25472//NITZ4_007873-RA/size33660-augustus-gene-0.19-mRNA-1//1//CDS//3329542625//5381//frame0